MTWITILLSLFSAIPKFISELGGLWGKIEKKSRIKKARARRKVKDEEVDKAIRDAINLSDDTTDNDKL